MLNAVPDIRTGAVREATGRAFARARENTRAPAVPGHKPVSVLALFRVLLAVRWVVLLLVPVQESVGTAPAGNWVVWAAIVVAVVYMLMLTLFSKRVLELHLRSPVIVLMDLAVATAVYATGQGTSWPFFLFSTTTILIPALYGRVGIGLAAAVVWNVITFVVQWARGVPLSLVFGIPAIEDLFNMSMVAAAWAYSIGLTARLNIAYEELARNRDELATTNFDLDDRERQILCLLDVGEALLAGQEAGQIVSIVADALAGMGFGRTSVWLVEEGLLRVPGTPDVHLEDAPRAPAAVIGAVNLSEPVIREPGGEPVPGLDDEALGIIVPVIGREGSLGVLVTQSASGAPWTSHEIEMLTLFADQTALGLEHVSFERQGRELAAAEEHDRITLEIHDGVIHKIYGAELVAGKLARRLHGAARAKIEQVHDLVRRSRQDLRLVVLDWQSLEWQEPLALRVERYASEFSEITGVEATARCSSDPSDVDRSTARELTRRLGQALYRARRDGARCIRALVDFGERGVVIAVEDGHSGQPGSPEPD